MQLWKELIIDYCRAQKIFVIGLEEDFPLFSNPAIESKYFLFLGYLCFPYGMYSPLTTDKMQAAAESKKSHAFMYIQAQR